MLNQNLSVEQIKQIAETAIGARAKATEAKKAAEDAGGVDETLNAAAAAAETAATTAEGTAQALSQKQPPVDTSKKISKLKRKQQFIKKELQDLGAGEEDEEDEDDELDLDDPDRPLTVGDLHKINARNATQSANEMAEAIEDAGDKEAVKAALKRVVPSGDPDADFKSAVAIANIERNSKVLEEVGRRGVVRRTPTRTGAAPNIEEAFKPTEDEVKYMRPPFNLSKADILAARGK